MKMQTDSRAYGFLAGAFFWIAVMLTVTCGACLPHALMPTHLALGERDARTVSIERLCVDSDPFKTGVMPGLSGGRGSGVIMDSRTILTALHVVECPYLRDIHVTTSTGKRVRATIDRSWPDRDIVRLIVDAKDGFGDVAPLAIGRPPEVGTVVCTASAVPERGESCGPMSGYSETPTCPSQKDGSGVWCHDTLYDAIAISGNSGSGMYDEAGALVGILTGGSAVWGISMPGAYGSALWPIRGAVHR